MSSKLSGSSKPAPTPNNDSKLTKNDSPVKSEQEEEAEDSNEPTQRRERKRRLDVDPSMIISEGRSKRRKSPTPGPEDEDKKGDHDPKDPVRAKMLGTQIYEKIMKKKDSKGEMMHEPFVKLPNKRAFPDYYETIKHPMSLEIIHERLQASGYETLRDVCNDLGQMFTNAKRYNIKESTIFQYAKKLHKMTRTFYTDATSRQPVEHDSESEQEGEPTTSFQRGTASQSVEVEAEDDGGEDEGEEDNATGSGVDGNRRVSGGGGGGQRKRGTYMKSGPSVYKLIKPIVRAIKEARSNDGRGREVAAIFLELPDRVLLPDYFQAIKLPISLNEIENKMIARSYSTPEQFYEDVELMCNNAMFYNEDASVVYNDAQQIKGILEYWKIEVKDRLSRPALPKIPSRKSLLPPPRTSIPPQDHRLPPPIPNYQPPPSAPQSAYSYGSSTYPPALPPPTPSYQTYPPQAPPTPSKPYLPALPQGVVTEDIVSSLTRYPIYEQQAWIASLPASAKVLYNQLQATIDSRKRDTVPTQQGLSLAQGLGDVGRTNGEKRKPSEPVVKYFDVGLGIGPSSTSSNTTLSLLSPLSGLIPSESRPISSKSQTIRIHNKRGVVIHSLTVGQDVSEVEITAYISDTPSNGITKETEKENKGEDEVSITTSPDLTTKDIPELSLRINGNISSLPRFIYTSTSTLTSTTTSTANSTSSPDPTPDILLIPSEKRQEKEKPIAMRWVVGFNTGLWDSKIEVVASKSGAGEGENCLIFLNRQY